MLMNVRMDKPNVKMELSARMFWEVISVLSMKINKNVKLDSINIVGDA